MLPDRPITGILLMLAFCVIAPMGDAVAKLLSTAVPIGQVVLLRFLVQAALLIPLVWATRRMWRMRGRVLWLAWLRTCLHILGIAAMFVALRYLPLADAIAIVFVLPFFMLLLGKFILKEEVGHRRLLACAVGFIGTLMVIQPSFQTVGWPALIPVGVAANFALFMLLTRQLAKDTDPIGLQAVSGVMAVILILPALWIGNALSVPALALITPTPFEWGLLMGIGVLGTVAHLFMTWALRFAPSATLAPMQYLEIPFATVIGFVIFQDLPNPLATFGIALTITAGLYIIMRERAIALRQGPPEPSATPA